MLLDPAKQQLDLPAFAIERGDGPSRALEIVAQDGEQTTILAVQDDPAQADRQPQALLRGELDHAVALDRRGLVVVLADRALAQHAQRHIALGPGHKTTAGLVQTPPPGVIGIGFVEHVSGARLDRLTAPGHHVVDRGRSNFEMHGPVVLGIVGHMRLQTARAAVPFGPFVQAAQRDRRGVDQPHHLPALARQRASGQGAQLRKDLGKDRAGPSPIGIRQGRPANRSAPQVIMMHGLRIPHRFHFAQARQPTKLPKHQRHQMVPGRETLDVFVPAMPVGDRGKAPSWKRFQQTAEHRILVAHAKPSFLSLFNQKDTTKPRWRLACPHNWLIRSPD